MAASGNDGASAKNKCSTLNVEYPSSSPYVTAVATTDIRNQTFYNRSSSSSDNNHVPEICRKYERLKCIINGTETGTTYNKTGVSNGGGFSQLYKMPYYQKFAVGQYFKQQKQEKFQLPTETLYNRNNRATPDISIIGHNLFVIINPILLAADGTSLSTPIFAGIVSILNSYSLNETQKPLGFLNPLLYKMHKTRREKISKCYNDITIGDNIKSKEGFDPHGIEICQGFYASKGWDPVTGLGTPNVGEMIKFIKHLAQIKRKCLQKKTMMRVYFVFISLVFLQRVKRSFEEVT